MKTPIFVLLLAVLSFSCSTSTSITGTWKAEPLQSHQFRNLAIIGIANNPEIRKTFEDQMETQLDSRGFNTTGALMFLPPQASKENISREIVIELLKSNEFDGVIAVSLVRREEESRYIQGQYYFIPSYDMPFYDYYGQMSSYYYSPGYYEESVTYFLQTNLYNFPEGKLLWSAQSKTTPLKELTETAGVFAKAIADELINSNVIKP